MKWYVYFGLNSMLFNKYTFQVEMEGLTGQISFDSLGFRSNFNLDIVELKKEGLTKVGSWNRILRNFLEK